MLGRNITAIAVLLTLCGSLNAQDLGEYDLNDYSGGFAEGSYSPVGDELLYPYDAQEQWQHGYIQYMPFYGAYKHFRPYNYKHVSAQAQTASGWGMSPRMPYSQQFWHRYQAHAKMGHSPSGAYESYIDVPVQKRQSPNNQQPQRNPNANQPELAPTPERGPLQLMPPANNGNSSPNSVQFQPGSPDSYSGVSFQQPPYSAGNSYQQQYGQPPANQYRPNQYQPNLYQPVPQYQQPFQPATQFAPQYAPQTQPMSGSGGMSQPSPSSSRYQSGLSTVIMEPSYDAQQSVEYGTVYESGSQQPIMMVP